MTSSGLPHHDHDEIVDDRRSPSSFSSSSRRAYLASVIRGGFAGSMVLSAFAAYPRPSCASSDTVDALLSDLSESLAKLNDVPSLLRNSEWDKVRTILKTPPVNQLWNLGDDRNALTKLAKETGEMGLLEMRDELSISLQMTDQYSYDNNFIYYQPGEFFPFSRFAETTGDIQCPPVVFTCTSSIRLFSYARRLMTCKHRQWKGQSEGTDGDGEQGDNAIGGGDRICQIDKMMKKRIKTHTI